MSTIPPAVVVVEVLPRQCGRCRKLFDGDPTLYAGAMPDWWLCPACRIALLGDHPSAGASRAH
jgi:hypothetical protein